MRYLPTNELAARPCIVVDGAPRAEALITVALGRSIGGAANGPTPKKNIHANTLLSAVGAEMHRH
jgi:hypothetical protein